MPDAFECFRPPFTTALGTHPPFRVIELAIEQRIGERVSATFIVLIRNQHAASYP